MTTTPAQALEAVRALAVTRANGEPAANELSILTRAMLEAFEIAGSKALLPLWAASRLAEDDPLVRRALSFVIARFAPDFDADRWLPMLWLLTPPHSRDSSTLQNCLTALQRHPKLSGVALRILRREIGSFLVDALDNPALKESVVDVLYAYVDAEVISHVLTTRDAHVLQKRLRASSLSNETDDPAVEAATALATEIEARTFQDEFPDVIEDLRAFIDSRTLPLPVDDWTQVLHWTEEEIRGFTERYATFEDLTAVAMARNVPVHEIRVSGRWANVGKLPIDFLEKILHIWRRFYTEIRSAFATDGGPLDLFVLAPTRGSFAVRILVDAEVSALELDAKVADEAVALVEAIVGIRMGTGRQSNSLGSTPLVRLVAEQGVDLEIGLAIPGPAGARHRIRIGHVRARLRMVTLDTGVPAAMAPVEITGVLDGANHRTGKFEMLPADGSAPIMGTAVRQVRSILLDKTIGNTYRFEIGRTADPATGLEKYELLRLFPLQGQQALATGPIREVLAPLPSVITSALVPQVDRMARIVQVVEIIASGSELSPATIDLSQRHVDYHKHAARLLRLLSDTGELSTAGATLIALAPPRRLDYLAIQFEVSVVGHTWLTWAGVTRVAELDPETAFEFLRQRSDLKESMVTRRGRTLRRWARDLGGSVASAAEDGAPD